MAGDVIFLASLVQKEITLGPNTVIFAGFFYESHSGKIHTPGSPSSGLKRSILFRGAFSVNHSVLRIQDILVWIRIRIWIRGSMPLPIGSGFGSGCGSCYFRQWPSRCQQKTIAYYLLKVHLHHFKEKKSKRSHKAVERYSHLAARIWAWREAFCFRKYVIFIYGGWIRSSEAAMDGGRAAPLLAVNKPKKTGARSAQARTRGQNPLVTLYSRSYSLGKNPRTNKMFRKNWETARYTDCQKPERSM